MRCIQPGYHGGYSAPWVYYPGILVGIVLLGVLPGYPGGYTPSLLRSLPCIPGYTMVHTLLAPSVHPLPLTLRCPVMMPWALIGNNPWVGGRRVFQDPKGVREERGMMRVVTPLSHEQKDERLDNIRVMSHVSPMVGVCCAEGSSGISPLGHPIVEERCAHC